MEQPVVIPAIIANGASLSDGIRLGRGALSRIVMPAEFTGTALTFQTSYDGVTFNNLFNHEGTEYSVVAAAGRSIIVPMVDFLGVRVLKIRSGTSAAPTAQAAERAFQLVVQP